MTQAQNQARLIKYYKDKIGHEIELWKTGSGYEIVVKLDGVVMLVEKYDKERSAKKRYHWYVTKYVRGDLSEHDEEDKDT